MSISFCRARTISRTPQGRSAVSAAAYRAGEKLHDEESGKDWKYKKDEVVYSKITLPENAPKEFADRAALWNSVQKAETQANARLARELVIAFPNELSQEQAEKITEDFSEHLAKKGMCVDAAIHWKTGNHHAHLMLTTRKLDKEGKWAKWKERKEFARDEDGNKIPLLDENGNQKLRIRKGKGAEKQWKRVSVLADEWSKKAEYNKWKKELAGMMNRELEKNGVNEKVDYRSYKDKGSLLIPQVHEGVAAREIEKRGGKSFLCEENRKIREINKAFIEKDSALNKEANLLREELNDTVTFCTCKDLNEKQRKLLSKEVKPMLMGLQSAYSKQFPKEKKQFDFQNHFVKNAVFVKDNKGNFALVDINKDNAVKAGLLKKDGGAKTFTKDQVKGIGKNIKAVGKAIQSLFDENTTSSQHLKNAKDNIVEIFKTPPKAVFDIIKNPVTGILSLPGKIFSMLSNAAEAAVNMFGAIMKGGSDTPTGKLSDGLSKFPVNWATLSPLERERRIKKMEEEELERLCGSIDYKAPSPPKMHSHDQDAR